MKAILQFDLPQEEADHRAAVQARDVLQVLTELDRWLRNELKHGDRPELEEHGLQRCRDKMWDLIDDNNVDLDL